jgi:hypothetical protein
MSERDIQRRILLALAARWHPRGIFWVADTGVARSMDGDRVIRFGLPGQSDIQGVLDGRWVGVEVKTARGKQRQNQVAFQRAIEAAGGVYILARSEAEAIDGITRALDERSPASRS